MDSAALDKLPTFAEYLNDGQYKRRELIENIENYKFDAYAMVRDELVVISKYWDDISTELESELRCVCRSVTTNKEKYAEDNNDLIFTYHIKRQRCKIANSSFAFILKKQMPSFREQKFLSLPFKAGVIQFGTSQVFSEDDLFIDTKGFATVEGTGIIDHVSHDKSDKTEPSLKNYMEISPDYRVIRVGKEKLCTLTDERMEYLKTVEKHHIKEKRSYFYHRDILQCNPKIYSSNYPYQKRRFQNLWPPKHLLRRNNILCPYPGVRDAWYLQPDRTLQEK
ncbi:MAG: hypothetical protein HYV97_13685 [Bdellovibrio sp.]|nr:hypothetical protein [Bdellovibrio sp.]